MSKKQRNCDPTDPGDDHRGDYWDHVAFDPEHKLVLAAVPGARTEEDARAIVAVEQEAGPRHPRRRRRRYWASRRPAAG